MRRQIRHFAGANVVGWSARLLENVLLASLLLGCSDGEPTVTEGATSSRQLKSLSCALGR